MTELNPAIILEAGNAFKALPTYSQVMEQREAVKLRQLAQRREQQAYDALQAKTRRLGDIGSMAAQGNYAGARQMALAGGDFDVAESIGKMDSEQRRQALDKIQGGATVFYRALQLPPEERAAFIAQAAPGLAAHGYTPEQIANQDLSDNGLSALLASGQKLSDALKQEQDTRDYAFKVRQQDFTEKRGRYVPLGDSGSYLDLGGPDQPAAMGGGTTLSGMAGGGSSGGKSLGERNGNPGNIRDGKFARSQPGYLGPGDGGFARFAPGAGAAAQENLLRKSYVAKGYDTPHEIIERYAPASENSAASRANYKAYVARRLGIGINDQIPPSKVGQAAQAMREFETGNTRGGGPRVVQLGPKRQGSGDKPPSGFRFTENGDLEPIPGGPADSNYAGKPLTQQQRSLFVGKKRAVSAIQNQIGRVQRAMDAVEKGGFTGFLGGRVPGALDAESNSFDKAVAGLAPLIRQLTRVPGEGAMSDYESRLAEATLPSRTDTPEGRREALQTMKELIQNIAAGYDEVLGAPSVRSASGDKSAIPTMTPDQARNAPKGTRFRTTDGRVMVRQ